VTRPRTYQTEAIITKKTKLGEADRILTLYTPHLGKIQAVAKGVRRPRSKLSGHLELITHSLVSLARGRNLDTITGSQTIASFLPIKSDLDLSSYALYAIELVNQFTADHIENQRLFQLLLDTLERLCQGDNSELVLRYFELHLVGEVGYRPGSALPATNRWKPLLTRSAPVPAGCCAPAAKQASPSPSPFQLTGSRC
jgi:DNA repair protein RecO (recombination protein O)